jgi:hypothetical protein
MAIAIESFIGFLRNIYQCNSPMVYRFDGRDVEEAGELYEFRITLGPSAFFSQTIEMVFSNGLTLEYTVFIDTASDNIYDIEYDNSLPQVRRAERIIEFFLMDEFIARTYDLYTIDGRSIFFRLKEGVELVTLDTFTTSVGSDPFRELEPLVTHVARVIKPNYNLFSQLVVKEVGALTEKLLPVEIFYLDENGKVFFDVSKKLKKEFLPHSLVYAIASEETPMFRIVNNLVKLYRLKYWEEFGEPIEKGRDYYFPKIHADEYNYIPVLLGRDELLREEYVLTEEEFTGSNYGIIANTPPRCFYNDSTGGQFILSNILNQKLPYDAFAFTQVIVPFDNIFRIRAIFTGNGYSASFYFSPEDTYFERYSVVEIMSGYINSNLFVDEAEAISFEFLKLTVILEYDGGEYFQLRWYYIDPTKYFDRFDVCFLNGKGGYDTLCCHGNVTSGILIEGVEAENHNLNKRYSTPENFVMDKTKLQTRKVFTGWLTAEENKWIEELFVSDRILWRPDFEPNDDFSFEKFFVPVKLLNKKAVTNETNEFLFGYELEFEFGQFD